MKRIIYISLGLFLFNSCLDKVELRNVKVLNNSNFDIYCLNSSNDYLVNQYGGYNDFKIFEKCFKISKDSFGNVYNKPRDWGSYISQCEGGKMRLFFISKDSVKKYGWKRIITKNIYIKRYKLDINDLNKNEWQVEFDLK